MASATQVCTRSRGAYTTVLSATPLQSDQVAQHSRSHPKTHKAPDTPLNLNEMTAGWQDIGYYKIFSSVRPESFDTLKPELKQRGLSYIYRAPKNELIIMVPSNVHEHTIQAIADYIRGAMFTQRARNPELDEYWTLHNNKGAFFEVALDRSTTFQPDLGIYNNNNGLLLFEVVFCQPWDDLVPKVERMVEGEECWGVLVVKITEVDHWSPPTRRPKVDDFVAEAEWVAQAKASRVENPYGPVCIKGTEWTKAVNVEVCFFSHAWTQDDGCPTMHQLNASGSIDFHDLDDELAKVWHRMIEHIGDLYDVTVHPVPFAISWEDVRKGVIAGLVLTGQARYVRWGGLMYKKRCRQQKAKSGTSGPSKFKKQKVA